MNLEQAFNAYYHELVRFGNKMILDKQAVEDIIIDIFVALKNPDMDGLRFYLYRSVKNRCLNYLEHIKNRKTVELRGDEWIEGAAMIEADILKKMHDAIQYLTHAEREVIDLYLQGKKTKEIAVILNKQEVNIRSIKRFAVMKLRKAIL